MILDDICALSRERAALLDPSIRKIAEEMDHVPQSLLKSVKKCHGEKNAVIAEIKYKTPSDKTIASELDPADLARLYEAGGACAVSVLTEPGYFSGSAENLTKAKSEPGFRSLERILSSMKSRSTKPMPCRPTPCF